MNAAQGAQLQAVSQLTLALSDPRAGRSRKNDAQTAKDAGASCDAQHQRDVLLRELRATTVGRTADELERFTGIPRYIVASRLAQMRRDNLVEPFGTRENQHGRQVQVWFANYLPRAVVTVESELL